MNAVRSPLDVPVRDDDSRISGTRLAAFAAILVLLLFLLVVRLWYLQIYRGDHFRAEAEANSSRRIRAVAPRGTIEDSKGRVIVTNRAQFTVFVTRPDLPKDDAARNAVLSELARILGVTWDELMLTIKRNRAGASDPIPVQEGVSIRVVTQIAENQLRLPGVNTQVEPVRFYPDRSLAAHLVGSIGQINDRELARPDLRERYQPGDFIGKTGIEARYDDLLNGVAGGNWFQIDARGRRQRELRVVAPVPGATLHLTIDKDVQAAAVRAMNGRHGAAVAIDPRSGRVIALVSNPSYDPNVFTRRLTFAQYKALTDPNRNYPLQNRAVSSVQPPGSTFKIITAAAGLATGTITASTGDYCTGGIPMGRRIKRCHSRHGAVNLESALAASCDVFFYHSAFRTGPEELAKWSNLFGLGHRTGIDIPSERAGTVPSPEWKREMAPKFGNSDTTWYKGDTANMAIGQGDVQASPLQMAQVAAAIGSRGTIYRPQILEKAVSPGGQILYRMKPEVQQRVPLSAEHFRLIAQGLREVVVGPRGTSHRAALKGVEVAGKSGSAETRTGGPTHAWFVCYAPFDKPTIAICVFLESNGQSLHGGSDAAPIARTMMAAHFGVPDEVGAASGSGSRAD